MSSENGRLTKCDRCGKAVFVRCIGEGEMDGGYTRWNKFEPLPAGWEYSGLSKVGTLCPDCAAEWEYTVKSFMHPTKKEGE